MADIEQYLGGLAGKGNEGLPRGSAARLLRRMSTPRMRFNAKLYGTSIVTPLSRRRASALVSANGPVKVNLGSGSRRIPGWLSVDLLGMGSELPWNLRHGLPFPPGGVHAVFLEHVLEHFLAKEAMAILAHVHDVLAPNGVVRVGVPDFGRYMASYAGDGSFVERNRPGRPTTLLAVAEVITCHGHRSVWDGTTMVKVLEEVGFVECAVRPFGVSCLSPAPDTPARERESVYVEARKAAVDEAVSS